MIIRFDTCSLFAVLFCMFTARYSAAHPSWGIVVDAQRNIYFADIMHHGRGAVWKFSNDGDLTCLLKDFHAHNVSLDNQGNLVTAHGEDLYTMVRIGPDAKLDTLYQHSDQEAFFGGNCTLGPEGEIVFGAKNYLWRIKNGEKQRVGQHFFEWNQTVYADEEGIVYGPDIGDGKGTLIKIDHDGSATVVATNLITKLDRPYDPHADVLLGITKGCNGLLYIAETAGRRIVQIQKDGTHQTFYTSPTGWMPTGIDFFAGDAYILEFTENLENPGPRIVRIDESGQTHLLFDYNTYGTDTTIGTEKGAWNHGLFFLIFLGTVVVLAIGAANRRKRLAVFR